MLIFCTGKRRRSTSETRAKAGEAEPDAKNTLRHLPLDRPTTNKFGSATMDSKPYSNEFEQKQPEKVFSKIVSGTSTWPKVPYSLRKPQPFVTIHTSSRGLAMSRHGLSSTFSAGSKRTIQVESLMPSPPCFTDMELRIHTHVS